MNTPHFSRNVIALGLLSIVAVSPTPAGGSQAGTDLPLVRKVGWSQTGIFSAEETICMLEAGDMMASLAVRDLPGQKARNTIPALMHFAEGEGSVDVMLRIACVRALADFRGEDVRNFFERIVTSAAVDEYREEIVRAIGVVGSGTSLKVLDRVPAGPDSFLVRRALERAQQAIQQRLRYRVAPAASAA